MSTSTALAALPAETPIAATTVRADPAMEFITTLQERAKLAGMLARSGMIPQKSPEAALAVMLKGYELGVPPMAAFANIHFIDGKLSIGAQMLLGIASGRYGVKAETLERSEERVRMRFTRPGWAPYENSFSMEEARRAGLAGKNNWKNYPKAMMAARCITDGVRNICPEVGAGVYDPDELGAVTTQTGEVVSAPPARDGAGEDAASPRPSPWTKPLVDTTTGEVRNEPAQQFRPEDIVPGGKGKPLGERSDGQLAHLAALTDEKYAKTARAAMDVMVNRARALAEQVDRDAPDPESPVSAQEDVEAILADADLAPEGLRATLEMLRAQLAEAAVLRAHLAEAAADPAPVEG